MSAPQGLIIYSGIQALLEGQFTLCDGVQPSLATLYIPPQAQPLPLYGDLQISYGGKSRTFTDCKLVHFSSDTANDGLTTWSLTVADSRWRWKYARISGEYNLRNAAGQLRSFSPKDTRGLAELLFKALGVAKYDLGDLPAEQYPEIHWDEAHADAELYDLCNKAGCRVIPRANGRFTIAKAGKGATINRTDVATAFALARVPPTVPPAIVFVAGRSKHQQVMPLQAMAFEDNGDLKTLDKVSYKPKFGWSVPDFANVDANRLKDDVASSRREAAQRSVFKVYQPIFPLKLPGLNGTLTINYPWQIELLDLQVLQELIDGEIQNRPAWLWGQYYHETHQDITAETKSISDPVKKPAGFWYGGSSIDGERTLVMFDEYCRLLSAAGDVAAKMLLLTACHVRATGTNGWQRHSIKRKIANNSAPELRIVRDDVALAVYKSLNNGKIYSNLTTEIQTPGVPATGKGQVTKAISLQKSADYYTDKALEELQIEDAGSVELAGLIDIDLDGAIRQVTWSVLSDGAAKTMVSRNTERLGEVPSAGERAFNSLISASLDQLRRAGQTK